MDPVLTLILLLAIIASLLYFYFWIRSIARKVDRRGLDVRLEELESSVRETTRWLETASGQIREELESRTSALKNLLQDAENKTVSSRSRADQSAAQATQASPASTDLEPPTEFEPAASGAPATDGMGIANQQSIDTSPPLSPSPTPLEFSPEPGLDPVEYPEFPPAAVLDDLQPAAVDTPIDPVGDPEIGDPEAVPLALEIAEPAPVVPDDSPPDDDEPSPAPGAVDRRAQILQLADQGVELAKIARQLDTSRAEVELIVSFRRPH